MQKGLGFRRTCRKREREREGGGGWGGHLHEKKALPGTSGKSVILKRSTAIFCGTF